MVDVDIFVGNNTFVDLEVYQLWLNGHSAHEAASLLQRRGVLQQHGATFDMLLSDTLDHYRTFAMLERHLKHPGKIGEQLIFQITAETQKMLIENYYTFDSAVVREILGKKLSARDRNLLDDVSEKTKVPLKSCRRQFDNVKRVFKSVEELTGSLVENIKTHFLLSDKLAQEYAAIVFLSSNRFETNKRKLLYLTFEDFVHCANDMISNWSQESKDHKLREDTDVELDKEFLVGLRDLKILSEARVMEEHKMLMLKSVSHKLTSSASQDMDNFKSYSKVLVNIAIGLNHSKELRDLFLDIVEKFIEPCRQADWASSDVETFLHAYQETAHHFNCLSQSNSSRKVWDRYMRTMISCLLRMYHT